MDSVNLLGPFVHQCIFCYHKVCNQADFSLISLHAYVKENR